MKRICCLLLCCAVLLTGCAAAGAAGAPASSAASSAPSAAASPAAGTAGSPSSAAADSPSSAASSAPAVPRSTGTEGRTALSAVPGLANENSLEPPDFLSGDQQLLYMAAYRMYYRFDVSSGFSPNFSAAPLTAADGFAYYPDDAFATWKDFDKTLRLVFTDRFADELLNTRAQAYHKGDDGRLYVSPADRGGDISFKSSSFELTKKTDAEIDFDVVGVYNENNFDSSAPSVPDTTRRFPIRLLLTGGGWRFDSFALPY